MLKPPRYYSSCFAHKQIGPYNLVDTIIVLKFENSSLGYGHHMTIMGPIIVMFEMIKENGKYLEIIIIHKMTLFIYIEHERSIREIM
jgi:hypothetical protein